MSKFCKKCSSTLDLSMFTKDKSKKDGLSTVCKICRANYAKSYRENNSESIKEKDIARKKEYYNTNSSKVLQSNKKYISSEKGKISKAITNMKRRSAIKNGDVSIKQLENLIASSKHCHYCNSEIEDFEIDHKVPVSKGGKHTIDNLVISCKDCNRKKSNMDYNVFLDSIHIKRHRKDLICL